MRVAAVNAAAAEPRPKYDLVSRCLHTALATGVVIELLLQAVMRVPQGVGLGRDDWHREAFELHAHFGPTVALICVLFWSWIALPFSRPGIGYLFPWLHRARRLVLRRELMSLRRRLPAPQELSPLVGTLHGLGLLAVSGTAVAGFVSYLGYYTSVHISPRVLHESALALIVLSWLVWPFVAGHVSMALWHWSKDHRRITRQIAVTLLLLSFPVSHASACARTSAARPILSLEQVWMRAAQSRNLAVLEKILRNDYVDITYRGTARGKADALHASSLRVGHYTQRLTEEKVRCYGHVAVVTGLGTLTTADHRYQWRFTDVFVLARGTWRVASSQETPVAR